MSNGFYDPKTGEYVPVCTGCRKDSKPVNHPTTSCGKCIKGRRLAGPQNNH